MDGFQRGIDRGRRDAGVRPLRGVPARRAAAGRGAPGRSGRSRCRSQASFRPTGRRGCAGSWPPAPGSTSTHARLDRSAHPFCGGTPTDVRITTRYDESRPGAGADGRAARDRARAVRARPARRPTRASRSGEAAGMAAHESQSLIVEMQACRSDAFLGLARPASCTAPFGGDAGAVCAGEPARGCGAGSSAASSASMPTR